MFDRIYRGAFRAQSVACKATLESLHMYAQVLFEYAIAILISYVEAISICLKSTTLSPLPNMRRQRVTNAYTRHFPAPSQYFSANKRSNGRLVQPRGHRRSDKRVRQIYTATRLGHDRLAQSVPLRNCLTGPEYQIQITAAILPKRMCTSSRNSLKLLYSQLAQTELVRLWKRLSRN